MQHADDVTAQKADAPLSIEAVLCSIVLASEERG